MRVINLLPWREVLYRRRRRNFVIALLSLTTAGFVWASISFQINRQNRFVYNDDLAHLQATLSFVEQNSLLLQQALGELAGDSELLHSLSYRLQHQRDWQQLMAEWQLLAKDAHITDIRWQGSELLLSGVTDVADPLRRLVHNSPWWQLEEIVLDAQTRFRFVVSRAMQTEGGI